MKKGFIGIFSLLAIAFLVVTFSKYSSEDAKNNTAETAATAGDKVTVLNFWDAYHKATDLRTVGKYQQALEAYGEALEVKPKHTNSLYYIGNMQLVLGDYRAAEQSWTKLVSVNPSSARGHSQLGILYSCSEKGNPLYNLEKAGTQFRKATELNREETGPLLQLAKINLVKEQKEDASKQLNDVVASNFRSAEAIFLQGYLAWEKGDLKKAENLLLESHSIVAGTTEKKNVGEGDTKPGSSHMNNQPLQCDVYNNLFKELINGTDKNPSAADIYREFNKGILSSR